MEHVTRTIHIGRAHLFIDDARPAVYVIRCDERHELAEVLRSEWVGSGWEANLKNPDFLVECDMPILTQTDTRPATPPTQHPRERGELVALLNSRPDWRGFRDYGLALYDAGLPVSLCFWMVKIEAERPVAMQGASGTVDSQHYRFGILVNHLARISAVDPGVYSRLPVEWFGSAVTDDV